MNRFAKMAVTGVLATTACAGVVAPAEARVGTGVAIGAGLLGLGVGAAIASDHPRRYYYDNGYYALRPPPVAYYAPPPPPPPTYAYDTVQRCRVIDRWDGYYGRYVRTRRCW